MRVFFDASVLIAAILSPTGGSSLLISQVKSGKITGLTSQTAIDEVLEHTSKINKTKSDIENFISLSDLVVRERVTVEEIEPLKNQIDIDDAHLVAGAQLTQCSHLVTLDKKHLLRKDIQEKFLPLKIVSPKEILEEMTTY